MTRTQIEDALTVAGFNTDEWISIGDSFKYILLHSDKNSISDDSAVQYYFSSTYDYVLMRYLRGRPRLTTVEETIPAGYVKIYHEGKPYMIQIEPGGKLDESDDDAGLYHNITSFFSIVGLFKK
jgi:hypothetical protein